jgi:tRNA-specific 2-thiouridylase
MKKVLVAMSGGVDSSMSLVMLKKQGYSPVGVTLKLVEGSRCCDIEAVSHAKTVCEKYGVPHYVFDVSKSFKKTVINYFIDELRHSRTPNPCVMCNRFLKFAELFKIAKKLKIDFVATGHYALIKSGELFMAKDKAKDQSYYLCFLKKEWLKKILFPIGKYTKNEVYKMAGKEGLDFLVEKRQSQDLCFIDPKLKGLFVSRLIKEKKGKIVDVSGAVLGTHNGIHNYTIGQGKGLNLSGGPLFVIGFNEKKNFVIISNDENDPRLFSSVVKLKNVNFVSKKPRGKIEVMAKIRYQQKLSKAVLNGSVLEFKKPQRAVTKGQIAVFYRGWKCLGGGVIK